MKRFTFFSVIFFALALGGRGQVNLVYNGSFEILYGCPNDWSQIDSAVGWHNLITVGGGTPDLYNTCSPQSSEAGIPINHQGAGFQYPYSGNGYAGIYVILSFSVNNGREYIQSQLTRKLKPGSMYCVKFYSSMIDYYMCTIKKLGAYLDDGSVSTPSQFGVANASPQVYNSTIQLNDKVNWMKIEGSFIATGNENFITIGNFFTDAESDTSIIGSQTNWYSFYYIDDVSVIDADLPATAGNDILIHPGDSTFIGRPSEVGLDEDCIWFVNGIPIDTIAGLWVKPDTTTTYLLQQTICGNIKYDTITVTVSGVGVQEYNTGNNWVHLFPNPASTQINIESNSAISEIIITDISGKTILKQTVNNSERVTGNESDRVTPSHPVTNVDISRLAPGLYFIKIISDKQSLVRKFMVNG